MGVLNNKFTIVFSLRDICGIDWEGKTRVFSYVCNTLFLSLGGIYSYMGGDDFYTLDILEIVHNIFLKEKGCPSLSFSVPFRIYICFGHLNSKIFFSFFSLMF